MDAQDAWLVFDVGVGCAAGRPFGKTIKLSGQSELNDVHQFSKSRPKNCAQKSQRLIHLIVREIILQERVFDRILHAFGQLPCRLSHVPFSSNCVTHTFELRSSFIPRAFKLHSACVQIAFRVRSNCILRAFKLHSACVRIAFHVRSNCVPRAFEFRSTFILRASKLRSTCVRIALHVRLNCFLFCRSANQETSNYATLLTSFQTRNCS